MTNKTTPEERLLHSSDYAREAINDEAQAVLGLLPQIDENFEKAVNMMYHCHGKVIVTGVGKSGNIGMKIAWLLPVRPPSLSILSMPITVTSEPCRQKMWSWH